MFLLQSEERMSLSDLRRWTLIDRSGLWGPDLPALLLTKAADGQHVSLVGVGSQLGPSLLSEGGWDSLIAVLIIRLSKGPVAARKLRLCCGDK